MGMGGYGTNQDLGTGGQDTHQELLIFGLLLTHGHDGAGTGWGGAGREGDMRLGWGSGRPGGGETSVCVSPAQPRPGDIRRCPWDCSCD